MTPDEARSIRITPENLRAVANKPCDGERSIILRRAADEIEHLLAKGEDGEDRRA